MNIIADLMPMKSLRYMRTLFISLPNSDIMAPAASSTSYSVQESLTNKATMAGLDDTCYYKCSLGLITIIHCLCSLFLSLLLTHCIAHFLSVSYTKTQTSSNFTAESDKIKHN